MFLLLVKEDYKTKGCTICLNSGLLGYMAIDRDKDTKNLHINIAAIL